MHHVLLRVHRVLGTALQTQRNEEAVHLAHLRGEGHLFETAEKGQVVVDIRAVGHHLLGLTHIHNDGS